MEPVQENQENEFWTKNWINFWNSIEDKVTKFQEFNVQQNELQRQNLWSKKRLVLQISNFYSDFSPKNISSVKVE